MLRTFDTPTDVPELVAAAGLALAIMRKTKSATWEEAAASEATAKLVLDADQRTLLETHGGALTFLRTTGPVTLAVCPECSRFTVAVAASAPTSCALTLGCGGKPVKATAAVLHKPKAAGEAAAPADDVELEEPPGPPPGREAAVELLAAAAETLAARTGAEEPPREW